MYMYKCIYIYIYTYIHIYTYTYMYICMNFCIRQLASLEQGSEACDDFEDAEADMLDLISMLANDDDTGMYICIHVYVYIYICIYI
jgi:hypothetical protein